MIFPFPKILFNFLKIPMTLFLLLLNFAVYFYYFEASTQFKHNFTEIIEEEYFYETQARVYRNFVNDNAVYYSNMKKKLILSDWSMSFKDRLISNLSLVDQFFTVNVDTKGMIGDQIAFDNWNKKFEQIQELRAFDPSFNLGLNSQQSWTSYISYQFMHASVAHLILNMLFLFFLGALLEAKFGSLLVLLTYLASGVFGALVFTYFSSASLSPLVGASGSISGLMSIFCILTYKKNMRYFYMLFIPSSKYIGYVYLPTWPILFFWFIGDLTGFLGQSYYQAGVAYTAHLGGQFFGLIIGLALLALWRRTQSSHLASLTNEIPYGHKIPLDVHFPKVSNQ